MLKVSRQMFRLSHSVQDNLIFPLPVENVGSPQFFRRTLISLVMFWLAEKEADGRFARRICVFWYFKSQQSSCFGRISFKKKNVYTSTTNTQHTKSFVISAALIGHCIKSMIYIFILVKSSFTSVCQLTCSKRSPKANYWTQTFLVYVLHMHLSYAQGHSF